MYDIMYKINDIYINHDHCLGHMLSTELLWAPHRQNSHVAVVLIKSFSHVAMGPP